MLNHRKKNILPVIVETDEPSARTNCCWYNNWFSNIYNFLTFYGFGRSPLFDIEDKYTDPAPLLSKSEDSEKIDRGEDYCNML